MCSRSISPHSFSLYLTLFPHSETIDLKFMPGFGIFITRRISGVMPFIHFRWTADNELYRLTTICWDTWYWTNCSLKLQWSWNVTDEKINIEMNFYCSPTWRAHRWKGGRNQWRFEVWQWQLKMARQRKRSATHHCIPLAVFIHFRFKREKYIVFVRSIIAFSCTENASDKMKKKIRFEMEEKNEKIDNE